MAVVDDDFRMGSLSRFPLMSTAEHLTWGLSWQTFPVSLWQRDKMWAFLQWEVSEEGKRRCHPATAKFDDGIRAITCAVNPPIVGRTYGAQRGGELLALRVMPVVARTWQEVIDRFRIVGDKKRIVSECCQGNWSQLVLDCGSRQVAIQCLQLGAGPRPQQMETDEHIIDWSVRYGADDLAERRSCVNLWGISLSGPVLKSPVVRPDPHASLLPRAADSPALLIEWEWPEIYWNVKVDLTERDPLKII